MSTLTANKLQQLMDKLNQIPQPTHAVLNPDLVEDARALAQQQQISFDQALGYILSLGDKNE